MLNTDVLVANGYIYATLKKMLTDTPLLENNMATVHGRFLDWELYLGNLS